LIKLNQYLTHKEQFLDLLDHTSFVKREKRKKKNEYYFDSSKKVEEEKKKY